MDLLSIDSNASTLLFHGNDNIQESKLLKYWCLFNSGNTDVNGYKMEQRLTIIKNK